MAVLPLALPAAPGAAWNGKDKGPAPSCSCCRRRRHLEQHLQRCPRPARALLWCLCLNFSCCAALTITGVRQASARGLGGGWQGRQAFEPCGPHARRAPRTPRARRHSSSKTKTNSKWTPLWGYRAALRGGARACAHCKVAAAPRPSTAGPALVRPASAAGRRSNPSCNWSTCTSNVMAVLVAGFC